MRLKKANLPINKKITLIIAVIMSFVFLYAGHFLFKKADYNKISQENTITKEPVRYAHITENEKGMKQEINILEVDVSNPEIKIMPVLSSDLIYGFEKLSSMADRKKAYAAINGGFFSEYGLPSGMVAIDGSLLTCSTGKYPVFTIQNRKAALSDMHSELWLEYSSGKIKVDEMNAPGRKGLIVAYTPIYGEDNRAEAENITVIVRNGLITDVRKCSAESTIPKDGMLITFYSPRGYTPDNFPLKKGDAVKFTHKPQLSADAQAYECGSWIIKDGRIVIGKTDSWVGVLTNHDPRTAIGIKKDGTVVLLTVDGRQPGFSDGMTGKELGELLLRQGVNNAAMLDGGASTEMIVNGKIVNKPSFKGQERPLGGGILVIK